jgi:hypothetical protein
MGSASKGPLWLWSGGAIEPFDVDRMQFSAFDGPTLGGSPQYGFTMLISNDGSALTGWNNGLSSLPYDLMHVAGRQTTVSRSPFGEGSNGRWMWPNADGSLIFGHGAGVFDHHFNPIAANWLKGGSIVPTVDRRYFLLIKSDRNKYSDISICTSNDRRIIFTLPKVENLGSKSHLEWGRVRGEPRVYYIPSAKTMITLPVGESEIVLRRISLPEQLQEKSIDYLYVDSFAPVRAYRGQKWRYQIAAHSNVGGLTYKLENGPNGMAVSSDGLVTWNIDPHFKDEKVSAIVSIIDQSGNEVLHTINFDVIDSAR